MQIRSTINGGIAECEDELFETLLETGHWVAASDAPVKKKRIRRTQEQIAIDNAEAASAAEAHNEE
jgi:F0F1-type ATP synthase epsilon subunit